MWTQSVSSQCLATLYANKLQVPQAINTSHAIASGRRFYIKRMSSREKLLGLQVPGLRTLLFTFKNPRKITFSTVQTLESFWKLRFFKFFLNTQNFKRTHVTETLAAPLLHRSNISCPFWRSDSVLRTAATL